MATDKPDRKRSPAKRPEEFDQFEELTRKLLRVPKREVDEAVKSDKKRRSDQS